MGNGVLGRLIEEENISDDVVADFIINLLFAGNETTAKTMLFAVYFLTHCPNAMKQLLVCYNRLPFYMFLVIIFFCYLSTNCNISSKCSKFCQITYIILKFSHHNKTYMSYSSLTYPFSYILTPQ